jgi:hypothetical protein
VGSPFVEDGADALGESSPRTATSVNVAPATSVNVAPATSVNVAPACLPDSLVQFPATPLALQSVAVGVGNVLRCASRLIASGNVGPSLPSRSGIEHGPFVASDARGVGSLRAAPINVGFPRM